MDVFLGGNRLPKRPLSPHCAEILAAFQARMGRLEADTGHGFWIQLQSIPPCCEPMGTGQETRRSYCANKEGSWGEQGLTTHRKGWEEISAHPKSRRQTSSLRILKAQDLWRTEALTNPYRGSPEAGSILQLLLLQVKNFEPHVPGWQI